ncbi:MAG TPA: hypothetical protein VGI77_12655 [Gaiellaceae bacterium]|jgi:hypothetical protein
MKILPLVLALAFLAAGTAQGRSAATCKWGATPSKVGCLAPYTPCTQAHQAAYRRHAYSCVGRYLQYDYSQLRGRAVRTPACALTPQDGTLKRNGYASQPAWGSPASPFMLNGSLVQSVEYDPGAYAKYGLFKAMWAIDPRYVGPVLVRGRQLDGDDVLKFEKGEPGFSDYTRSHPTTELHESGGYVHPSVTRVRTLGCYAYQVDGIGFSYSIVFRAVAA